MIVISNSQYKLRSEDVVVVAMTSNPAERDYSFMITSSDLTRGKLKRPSRVRVDRIYTLSHPRHWTASSPATPFSEG
ncbi:MAG: type II toxin-antitoxin system PemK/MazF family toxin [Anaerolineae bacterium]